MVRQQEQTLAQPPSLPYWGYKSLFVFLQALRLHCKHHCCMIHSRREAAVSEDWQVMGQQDAPEPHRRLEGKSWMTWRWNAPPAFPKGILSGSMTVGIWGKSCITLPLECYTFQWHIVRGTCTVKHKVLTNNRSNTSLRFATCTESICLSSEGIFTLY